MTQAARNVHQAIIVKGLLMWCLMDFVTKDSTAEEESKARGLLMLEFL